ncbi:MAG TPA: penicillin acylase family protein [Mycobacteriales bacterium]|nr:penicillin acylase family protein [Mycobacteriales bacterium]
MSPSRRWITLLAAGVVAATPLAALAPATASVVADTRAAATPAEPSFQPDQGGFRSVLGYGEGETTSALDLALFEANGTVPSSFTNQADLYNAVISGRPRDDADLTRYYKNSDFSIPTGGDVGSVEQPVTGVTVIRDKQFDVPHIYASTRSAGMYAAGYVSAEDRLFLMDVLRRTAEGELAGLLGASAIPGDSAQIGQFDLSPAELTHEVNSVARSEGKQGRRALADIRQYVAGINGYIDATHTNPGLLPAEYVALGTTPRAWTIADTAAEAYLLIAQFTVAGDGEQFQSDILSRLQDRLGHRRGRTVFDDLRLANDPDAMATATRRFPSDRTGRVHHGANAHLAPGTIRLRNAVAGGSQGASSNAASAGSGLPAWADELARHGLQLPDEESNALLVEGRHTRSGHPIAAMGPQVGYYSPEIFDEYELHMPGIQESGVVFPGASPYVLIGHTKSFAWTGTTALGDNADTFAEKLCNPDGSRPSYASTHYVYKGKCRAFTSRTIVEQTPVALTSPSPPQTVTLQTLRSVHGPVVGYAKVGRRPVALTRASAVYRHGVRSVVAFERLAENKVHSPRQFISTMRHFVGNENWFYVSRSHIAWFASGWFQRHAPHTSLQLPIWGTGHHDWVGFKASTYAYRRQANSFNLRSIDPKQGFLASWNNKGARGMEASPGTWSWGQVQRVEMLADPTRRAIRAGHKLTLAQLVGIAGNASTQDLRALKVLPTMLRVLGSVQGHREREVVADLRAWLRSGVHRRATHGRSYDDHSAAVMAFDAFWRQTVHRIYDPVIGRSLVGEISRREGLDLGDGTPTGSGFFGGWQSQLLGVLHKVMGVRDASNPRATYCGNGTLRSCQIVLRRAFKGAMSFLVTRYGGDPSHWRYPVFCGGDGTCDQNPITTAGAIDTPPQPFENRGTFHQAVEIK